MCGRYTLSDPDRFLAAFSIIERAPKIDPRYNIAPDQLVPVIRIVPPARRAAIERLAWGLVPTWVKDPRQRAAAGFINARIETVATKPAFAEAFRRRRCIVVADGFYEWKKAERRKLPYLVRAAGAAPLAIAGIWEPRAAAIGREADSFAILTMPALPPVDTLHDRMPAFVRPEDAPAWLDPAGHDVDAMKRLLERDRPVTLELLPVGLRVNSPANDDPACIVEADHDADGPPQRRLF